ncbi:MAG TPA: transglutaminase-like domain-containing protein [Terriglobales bacterium]|nr:transglutaminase-like domain-containing protein [Terriglobales bacterium]
MSDWASGLRGDFAALVADDVDEHQISVARAALTIARMEYPNLEVDQYIERLEWYAARVEQMLPSVPETPQVIAALNYVLFEEEKFRGNSDDYYDPRNSFLNDVLDRRTGIPITLALVYMEVAHRIGFPLFGVGMPGHFLLKHYDVDGSETLLDPFHAGSILSADDCQERLNQIYAGQVPLQPEFLHTVTRRQWLTRMLNNLRQIYLNRRDFKRALIVVDLVLAIHPRSAEDRKERGMLRYAVGQLRGAAEDLETYVRMAPDASDADEMRQTALTLRQRLVMMN